MRLNKKLASPQAWSKSKACDGFPDQIYVLDLESHYEELEVIFASSSNAINDLR